MSESERFAKIRIKMILFYFLLFFIIISVRSAILMIGRANKLKSNLIIMNRTPPSFAELSNQVVKLQHITSDIDNYTLSDIKDNLVLTANLAEIAGSEFQSQYNSWVAVKGQISKDNENFVQLKQKLDQVQKLQDTEVVRLSKLLDEYMKPTLSSIGISMFGSFIVGVLSSILASYVYARWPQRVRKKSSGSNGIT